MKRVNDHDHWLAKVQESGWALYYAPDHLKTPELCLEAVQRCNMYQTT